MAFGPGKYDDLASHVRGVAEAEGVLLLVVQRDAGQRLLRAVDARPHAVVAGHPARDRAADRGARTGSMTTARRDSEQF
jgi:hypothetical protein